MKLYIRLQEILDERQITQKELANMTQLRTATISELCNNVRTTINRSQLELIAAALEITDANILFEFRD